MQPKTRRGSRYLALVILCTSLPAVHMAWAETDQADQEKLLRARVMSNRQSGDHAAHTSPVDKAHDFHGVFYGYLPCQDCDGIKATLSLKQNNIYLLVTQSAKDSSREFYEKGKYTWNDETHMLALTSRKDGSIRQYRIADEGKLIQLNSDGSPLPGDSDAYALSRSDTMKSRQVHIH